MPNRFALLLALVCALTAPVRAEQVRRFALIVGSNRGATGDQPLRFAEADATRMANVLRYMGGFNGDVVEVYTPTVDALLDGAGRIIAGVREARARGEKTLLLFYFSGHSDGEALRTQGERLQFAQLRAALRTSGAPIRLLIVDACRAGALSRTKGATVRPPIEVRALGDLATEGEAFIASTTSDELARESAMLRGSFFTHHLVSGLRGAADRSGDGRISLAEAYDYAYQHTVLEAVGEQHPTYAFDLSGRGEVVLTSLQAANASIHFPPGPPRHIIISTAAGDVVAEIDVSPASGLQVALPPGSYEIRWGDRAHPRAEQIVLAPGTSVDAHPAEGDAIASSGEARSKGPNPVAPAPTIAPIRPRRASLLLGLGLGTAPVWLAAGSKTEVAYQLKPYEGGVTRYEPVAVDGSGGYAIAPLHIRLDVGVRLVERWELLASLRAQVYVGSTAESLGTESGAPASGGTSKSTGALAGLVRLRHRLLRGPVAPFVEATIGGGQVRARLEVSQASTADNPLVDRATADAYNANLGGPFARQLVCRSGQACYDSVAMGLALVGAGAGVQLDVVHGDRASLALSMSTTFLGAFAGGARGLVVDFELALLARVF